MNQWNLEIIFPMTAVWNMASNSALFPGVEDVLALEGLEGKMWRGLVQVWAVKLSAFPCLVSPLLSPFKTVSASIFSSLISDATSKMSFPFQRGLSRSGWKVHGFSGHLLSTSEWGTVLTPGGNAAFIPWPPFHGKKRKRSGILKLYPW